MHCSEFFSRFALEDEGKHKLIMLGGCSKCLRIAVGRMLKTRALLLITESKESARSCICWPGSDSDPFL